jgi:hypothetical protein
MRYFVKTLGGEKGPYDLAEIAESLRAGRLKKDALLRPEDGTTTVSVEDVVPRDGTMPASDPSARRRRRAPGDVYAPPEDDGDDGAIVDRGNYGNGFIFGFFCGCVALIWSLLSKDMGAETRRGVRQGFIVGLVVGVVMRVIGFLLSQN